jgi:hypothetical protein
MSKSNISDKVCEEMTQIRGTVLGFIKDLNGLVSANQTLVSSIERLGAHCALLEESLTEARIRIESLESERLGNNVMVYNLPAAGATNEDVKGSVSELLEKKLNLKVKPKSITVMGNSTADKPSPVRIEFNNKSECQAVLKSKTKLKGSPVYLQPDLPKITRWNRKQQLGSCMSLRKEGKRAYFIGSRLFVDGRLFEDDKKRMLYPLGYTVRGASSFSEDASNNIPKTTAPCISASQQTRCKDDKQPAHKPSDDLQQTTNNSTSNTRKRKSAKRQ